MSDNSQQAAIVQHVDMITRNYNSLDRDHSPKAPNTYQGRSSPLRSASAMQGQALANVTNTQQQQQQQMSLLLGTTTNQQHHLGSPIDNSFSTSGLLSLSKSPTFTQQKKNNQLEQENQMLKNQIEILKNALLGICKDKSQLPLPILSSDQGVENMGGLHQDLQFLTNLLQTHQTQQTQASASNHSLQRTPTCLQQQINRCSKSPSTLTDNAQKMQFPQDISAINLQKDENSLSKLSLCSSPSKSNQRRLRLQRKLSPTKEEVPTSMKKVLRDHSPNFREELPLQIQFKKGTDDTLVFDKSMDIYKDAAGKSDITPLRMNTSIEGEEGIITREENDKQDASQIQLKYAKMLEELENESAHEEVEDDGQTKQASDEPSSQEAHFSGLGQAKTLDVRVDDQILSCPDGEDEAKLRQGLNKNSKNQMSSHFEQKQFYEHELNNLKSELQSFERQEEQILSLINTEGNTQHNTNQPKAKAEFNSVSKVSAKDAKENDNFKTVSEQALIEMEVQKEVPDEANEDFKDENEQQEDLMRNLQDALKQLQLIEEDPEEETCIKPIKILSPTSGQNSQLQTRRDITDGVDSNQQIQTKLVKPLLLSGKPPRERYNRTPLQDKDVAQPYSSPIKYDVSTFNLFSADKQGEVGLGKSPTDGGVLRFETKDSAFNDSTAKKQIPTTSIKKSKVSSNAHPVKANQQPKHVSGSQLRVKRAGDPTGTGKIASKKDSSSAAYNDIVKSPSQFSVNNLLNTMALERNSAVSPIRHCQNFYSKQTSALPSAHKILNQGHLHEEKYDFDHDNTRMETIEKLARLQSMVHGLKQQVEPPDDEDERMVGFKHHLYAQEYAEEEDDARTVDNVQVRCNFMQENIKSEEDEVRIGSSEKRSYSLASTAKLSSTKFQEPETCSHQPANGSQALDYLGPYSFERAEMLKNQRSESIRKAEELLHKFLQESQHPSRPNFIENIKRQYSSKSQQRQSSTHSPDEVSATKNELEEDQEVEIKLSCFSPLIGKAELGSESQKKLKESCSSSNLVEKSKKYSNLVMCDMSFQQESGNAKEHQKSSKPLLVRESTRESINHYDSVNLEIQNTSMIGKGIANVMHFQQAASTTSKQAKQSSGSCALATAQSTEMLTPSMVFQTFDAPSVSSSTHQHQNEKPCESKPSHISEDDSLQPMIIMNQRRKSMGETSNAKLHTALSSKKKTTQLRKPQPIKNESLSLMADQTVNSSGIVTSKQQNIERPGTSVGSRQTSSQTASASNLLGRKSLLNRTQEAPAWSNHFQHVNPYQTPSNAVTNSKQVLHQTQGNSIQATSSQQSLQQYEQRSTINVEEPNIIKAIGGGCGVQTSMTLLDPEQLYEQRSKSVIKRREELLKKKQNETLNKIQAKYHKIEQFKATRNQNANRLSSNSKIHNISSEANKTVNISGSALAAVANAANATSSVLYHSKSKVKVGCHTSYGGSESLSHTPVRTKQQQQQPQQYQTVQQSQLAQSNGKGTGQASHPQMIKFERRQGSGSKLPPDNDAMTLGSTLHTPMGRSAVDQNSLKNVYGVPSSSQSISTKLLSECSSYRKRQSEYYESHSQHQQKVAQIQQQQQQQQERKSNSKPHHGSIIPNSQSAVVSQSNLAVSKKSQQQACLKNSIVNRTIRMTQPKDYVQLRQEQASKLLKQATLQSTASSANTTATNNRNNLYSTSSENHQVHQNTLQHPSEKSASFITSSHHHVPFSNQTNSHSASRHQRASRRGVPTGEQAGANQQNHVRESCRPISSSRSASRLSTANGNTAAYYGTSAINIQIDADLKQKTKESERADCSNCLRLISKGLSTDFCLEHFGTPRYIDD